MATTGRPWRDAARPIAFLAAAFILFLASAFRFDAGRPDFYYLADAFVHGRTWLDQALGPYDAVVVGDRVYVPFAPFPAFVLAPLVALVGPEAAAGWDPLVNALLATTGLALLWRLAGRLGVASAGDRGWLLALFGFSTATWWITMRGGVWHTGQLVASILTFLGLLEAFGRRRPFVLGLLAGAAFSTRATLLAALPYWGWRALPDHVRAGLPADLWGALGAAVRRGAWLALGFAPALAFALWYNAARFGNPFESGYGLAALPAFLEARRQLGVFSPAHSRSPRSRGSSPTALVYRSCSPARGCCSPRAPTGGDGRRTPWGSRRCSSWSPASSTTAAGGGSSGIATRLTASRSSWPCARWPRHATAGSEGGGRP
jgi:hypothetical protein